MKNLQKPFCSNNKYYLIQRYGLKQGDSTVKRKILNRLQMLPYYKKAKELTKAVRTKDLEVVLTLSLTFSTVHLLDFHSLCLSHITNLVMVSFHIKINFPLTNNYLNNFFNFH